MIERPMVFRRLKASEKIAQWLGEQIEAAYQAEVREPKVKQKKSFAPSSIGYGHGKCPRYWALAFEGKYIFEEKTTGKAIAIMSNGTKTHDRLQELMLKYGILEEAEIEFTNADPPIRGFIDGKIKLPDEDWLPILEIKSANTNAFDARKAKFAPSSYHLLQLLIYLKVMQIKLGVMLYEHKDTQDLLIIPVEMNEDNELLIEEVFNWMRAVRATWESGQIPVRPTNRKNATICKQCPLYNACWNEVPNEGPSLPIMEVELADS